MKGTITALVVGAVLGLAVLAVVDRTPTVYIGSPVDATFIEPTPADLDVTSEATDLDAAFEELDLMGKEMDELFEGLQRLQELMELEAAGKLWSA